MRAFGLAVGFALLSSIVMAQTKPGPVEQEDAYLTIDAPSTPPKGDNPPILQSITYRAAVDLSNGSTFDVVPDFHFTAPNGNAVVLRRELVDTSGAFSQTSINSATINIPAAAQKKGAVISGGWRCEKDVYYITLRAYILDADGNRSNSIQYTIHCNGG